MKPWNIIGWAVIFFFVFWTLGEIKVGVHPDKPNYEAMANCIAEYDYQHPSAPKFDNLVAALEVCH